MEACHSDVRKAGLHCILYYYFFKMNLEILFGNFNLDFEPFENQGILIGLISWNLPFTSTNVAASLPKKEGCLVSSVPSE